MQKIIYIKNYNGYTVGDIDTIDNNIAHGLIDRGIIKLYSKSIVRLLQKAPKDKMMRIDRTPNVDVIEAVEPIVEPFKKTRVRVK